MNTSYRKQSQYTRITCELALKRARSLSEAFQFCKGLFPQNAIEEFFQIDYGKTKRLVDLAQYEAQYYGDLAEDRRSSFHLSTWDFSTGSIVEFQHFVDFAREQVALLGVPSLLGEISKSKNSCNLLIDVFPELNTEDSAVNILSHDINTMDGTEFKDAFDVCILDSPWYPEHITKWIEIAANYCRDGGRILFPLFGSLTRPSAEAERKQLLNFCIDGGLAVEIHPEALLYKVPTFESAILRRLDIPAVPWKRADLVIATASASFEGRKSFGYPKALPPFKRVLISNVAIDVVFDRNEIGEKNLLIAPSGGYWMRTPSRRDNEISKCNIFTSNGARFISPRPNVFFKSFGDRLIRRRIRTYQ